MCECRPVLCVFSVSVSQQVVAGSWCVELQPPHPTDSLLVLQEHLSLSH